MLRDRRTGGKWAYHIDDGGVTHVNEMGRRQGREARDDENGRVREGVKILRHQRQIFAMCGHRVNRGKCGWRGDVALNEGMSECEPAESQKRARHTLVELLGVALVWVGWVLSHCMTVMRTSRISPVSHSGMGI